MIKSRIDLLGQPPSICCHTFRAAGITAYLENGGTLEHAKQIAAYELARTTQLYERSNDVISVEEIQKTTIQHTFATVAISSVDEIKAISLDSETTRILRQIIRKLLRIHGKAVFFRIHFLGIDPP
jgi:hypothetical protein